jgi:hypothetical protein
MDKFIYEVILTRDSTESCRVKVVAASHDEASELAIAKAGRYGQDVNPWERNDNNKQDDFKHKTSMNPKGP